MKTIFAVAALTLGLAFYGATAHAFEIGGITIEGISTQDFNAAQAAGHGDGEVTDELEWKAVVARADANRLAAETGAKTASAQSNQATDASGAGSDAMSKSVGTSLVKTNGACPGDSTDIAGNLGLSGEYCLPGGR